MPGGARSLAARPRFRDLGERGLIHRLLARVDPGRGILRGIGDDCAVARIEGSAFDWLLTTDPVIEGVHFTPGTPGRRVGHKAAGRVISDIAAMGGAPLYVLFNLVAPPETPAELVDGLYGGATAVCRRFGAAIVGGDIARGPVLEVHAFAVGRVPRGQAVLRSGARPGDRLFVTGRLGGSLRGRHLSFTPRVAEGQWLARGRWATAMLDLSDGLASDLRRMLEESRVGAELFADAIPVAAAARRMRDGNPPLWHALCDGEDFELLFAAAPRRAARLPAAWRRAFPGVPLTAIGTVTPAAGDLVLVAGDRRQPLAQSGYEHFVKRSAGPSVRRPLPRAAARRRPATAS